ncbi:MAG: SRPBCC family protein [Acidimicrobiia bacterium]
MRLHETRQIARPLEEVFEFTADFANSARWDPGVSKSTKMTDGPVGVGTKYDLVAEFGSSQVPMTYEIVEYEPPTRVVLTGRGETVDAVDEIVFSAREGGTFVDYTADLTLNNWLRFLGPVLSPMMRRVGERALDGLVRALEG